MNERMSNARQQQLERRQRRRRRASQCIRNSYNKTKITHSDDHDSKATANLVAFTQFGAISTANNRN